MREIKKTANINVKSAVYKTVIGDVVVHVNKQVGVREFKYGVIDDPLFIGHVTQPNFGPKTG